MNEKDRLKSWSFSFTLERAKQVSGLMRCLVLPVQRFKKAGKSSVPADMQNGRFLPLQWIFWIMHSGDILRQGQYHAKESEVRRIQRGETADRQAGESGRATWIWKSENSRWWRTAQKTVKRAKNNPHLTGEGAVRV